MEPQQPQPQPTTPEGQIPVTGPYSQQPSSTQPALPQQPLAPQTGEMNPFTGSINRKSYLIWNVGLTIVYCLIHFSLNSAKALVAYYVIAGIFGLLLIVRRLQNTGLNMLLLLSLLLPLANIIFLISLFFIPPRQTSPNLSGINTAGPSTSTASNGFKIAMGIVLGVFLLIVIAVVIGLSH
jgi:uncharacterized membrane protein YhaH (DUF805 family)